jgi:hypothetical protein
MCHIEQFTRFAMHVGGKQGHFKLSVIGLKMDTEDTKNVVPAPS